MAEIRKHSPAAGSIGDLVRSALGGGPRPVETGVQVAGGDPYDRDEPAPNDETSTTARVTDVVSSRVTWTSVNVSELPTVPKKTADAEDEWDDD